LIFLLSAPFSPIFFHFFSFQLFHDVDFASPLSRSPLSRRLLAFRRLRLPDDISYFTLSSPIFAAYLHDYFHFH